MICEGCEPLLVGDQIPIAKKFAKPDWFEGREVRAKSGVHGPVKGSEG
jgi:hypothetical protein